MEIVDFIYNLAREHKRIKGFAYGRTYEKGAGNDFYPLVWLDDPITGVSEGDNMIRYTLNIDVLGIPENDTEVLTVQDAAFSAALSIIEKIKQTRKTTQISLDSFSFISLRDYYDDNAAGHRFTVVLKQANPTDRCADDFDPDKQFGKLSGLPSFLVNNPEGCAVFSDVATLPNFKT